MVHPDVWLCILSPDASCSSFLPCGECRPVSRHRFRGGQRPDGDRQQHCWEMFLRFHSHPAPLCSSSLHLSRHKTTTSSGGSNSSILVLCQSAAASWLGDNGFFSSCFLTQSYFLVKTSLVCLVSKWKMRLFKSRSPSPPLYSSSTPHFQSQCHRLSSVASFVHKLAAA